MHSQFRIDMLRERSRELAAQANRARLLTAEPSREGIADEVVSLRVCRVSDDPILERLAALEGRELPAGRHLVAEVDGEVVAALPLAGGELLADPFRPTAHLLPLMRRHAATFYVSPRKRRARFNHWLAYSRTTTRSSSGFRRPAGG